MNTYLDLWTLRKRFTKQMGTSTFMTYLLSIGHRYLHKYNVSLETGNIWVSDLTTNISSTTYLFTPDKNETVPFRLTPNIQHFITPVGLEGPFTSTLVAIGRALSEPINELHDYLGIFCKDELVAWNQHGRKHHMTDESLKNNVLANIDLVIKRTQLISCKAEREQKSGEDLFPLNQSVLDLMNEATNPVKLAMTDSAFLPQF